MTDELKETGVIRRGPPWRGTMPLLSGKPKVELRRELWETAVEAASLVRKETGLCCGPLAKVIMDTYHRLCELEDEGEKKGEVKDGPSALSEPDHLAKGDAEGPSAGPGEKA